MSARPVSPWDKPVPETQMLTDPVQTALQIFRNGYHPLWLRPATKTPGHNGWLNNPPTENSIIREFKLAGNIGLIQGIVAADKTFAVTIDIDQDDIDLIACTQAAIGADCPQKRGKKERLSSSGVSAKSTRKRFTTIAAERRSRLVIFSPKESKPSFPPPSTLIQEHRINGGAG